MYGPLSHIEAQSGHNDSRSIYGPASRVKHFVHCLSSSVVGNLLEEGFFAKNHLSRQSNAMAPMIVVVQVNSKLHSKIVSKRHRQMLEMAGDVLQAAANNVQHVSRTSAAGVLTNGLEVQFIVMERPGLECNLTVSNVLTIGTFQQTNSSLVPYEYEFEPRESDLQIVLGIFKSMITNPSLFFKPLSEEEQSVLNGSYMRERTLLNAHQSPVKDYSKASPQYAMRIVRSLQEKRSPVMTGRSSSSIPFSTGNDSMISSPGGSRFATATHSFVDDDDSKSYIAQNLEALEMFMMESSSSNVVNSTHNE